MTTDKPEPEEETIELQESEEDVEAEKLKVVASKSLITAWHPGYHTRPDSLSRATTESGRPLRWPQIALPITKTCYCPK